MNLSSRHWSSITSSTCCTSSCSTTCSATPSLWSVPLDAHFVVTKPSSGTLQTEASGNPVFQACLLLSLESFYPPAHQLSLDMLKVTALPRLQVSPAFLPVVALTSPSYFQRLSTANDEIVEVLLSKHQVLAALRLIRGIGGHDNISARKFLDAARQTDDVMLFYTIFRFFEQRNQRLRGNPNFTPGKGMPRVATDNGSFHQVQG